MQVLQWLGGTGTLRGICLKFNFLYRSTLISLENSLILGAAHGSIHSETRQEHLKTAVAVLSARWNTSSLDLHMQTYNQGYNATIIEMFSVWKKNLTVICQRYLSHALHTKQHFTMMHATFFPFLMFLTAEDFWFSFLVKGGFMFVQDFNTQPVLLTQNHCLKKGQCFLCHDKS